MTGQLGHFLVGLGLDEIDGVVMGSNSQVSIVWCEDHGLDPLGFLDVLEQGLLDVVETSWVSGINESPVNLSDGDESLVVGNSQVLQGRVVGNAS